ncbi:hypothetical protein NY2A_b096L [Paramecium bursaria Chlorella virus NY2A]|uniref:Uncharacterized protein b096L n=1 Tax=Paramecium bursaria Chlorella virus NY2A TaxID=46021 RepID=A7IVX1_PBCVN|nr:hypothetical protein NY2A_b096L [Paramecium bursaria Chlorella virus NY2A]YP_001498165.1 hypothetical protein AR158_c083L [Paramecium bursaria Chlorella virus AR158]ABT14495.1 hypothetical protein NY2A_b096L [Paramecium bursaria Chlorella virus NY2A]ABU43629.1 hypothetical protein AR158_c083L [Paramecium bursaria Chlorella virus AR158]
MSRPSLIQPKTKYASSGISEWTMLLNFVMLGGNASRTLSIASRRLRDNPPLNVFTAPVYFIALQNVFHSCSG